jgi:SAM-dependent methyltransferase
VTGSVDSDLYYLAQTGAEASPLKVSTFAAFAAPRFRRILEVGCGPGSDIPSLGSASNGDVVGVDLSATMLAAAGRSLAGSSSPCLLVQADAARLPFPDGAFDGVRAERVLQHCPDPRSCVAEFARVVRIGGRIVLADTDWASLSISGPDLVTERRIVEVLREYISLHPTVGRDLPLFMAGSSLQVRAVEPTVVATSDLGLLRLAAHLDRIERVALQTGALDHTTIEDWRAGLEARAASGTLHATLIMITVVADRVAHRNERKPGDA